MLTHLKSVDQLELFFIPINVFIKNVILRKQYTVKKIMK